jgi:hypothetical protein
LVLKKKLKFSKTRLPNQPLTLLLVHLMSLEILITGGSLILGGFVSKKAGTRGSLILSFLKEPEPSVIF